MRSLASPYAVSLSFVLVAAACGDKDAGRGETASARAAAALVPPDTVAYARFASLDDLVATARKAVSAFGGDASDVDRDELLANLGGMAGDTTQIDAGRAIGVALVAAKATRPAAVVLVPVKDGAKYAASLRANGIEAVIDGGYAVLALGGEYKKPATPSPLANGMPAGLVAVRIDVAKASANLGVMINSGLDVFERQAANEMRRGAGASGVDPEVIAELYADFAKTLLASGSTIDLVVDEADGRASVTATYTAKPGSALDGWSAPPVDLSSFAGKLAGSNAIDVVAVADWARLLPKLEPMMTALLDIYPPAMRETMQGLLQAYPKVYERLGPVIVGGVDFAGGMRVDVHVAPPDAKALLAEVDALVKRPELAGLGMTISAGAASDDGGVAVRDYELRFDPSRLGSAAGAEVDDERAKEMAKQMTAVFQAMFGSDGVPVRIALADGRGAISVGKSRGDVAKALAPATGTWPAPMQRAMASVSGCNPMFVERFDFAAILRGMSAFAPASERGAIPAPPAGAKADVVVGGGVRGAEWRAFLFLDLAGLGATFRATQPR
jgi:hypothetical protein